MIIGLVAEVLALGRRATPSPHTQALTNDLG